MSYRDLFLQTFIGKPQDKSLMHAALGMSGEAGEYTDLIKKHLVYERPLDRARVLEELGDVRWYLELALMLADSSIEEIEKLNYEKLMKRHHNK